MSGGGVSLIGDLGKPAEALINRISDAIGGIAKPWQIKRVGKAMAESEVQAAIIKAEGERKLSELQERALTRLAREEARKQENIESISYRAIPHLKDDAKPESLDSDWLSNFFDQARNVSNEEVQELWARILACEASKPDSIPNSTLSVLRNVGLSDARRFESLLRLSISVGEFRVPLVDKPTDEIVYRQNLDYDQIHHLWDLGLINYNMQSEYVLRYDTSEIHLPLHGRLLKIGLVNRALPLGVIRLSFAGRHIASCIEHDPDPQLDQYVKQYWNDQGVTVEEVGDLSHHITTQVPQEG